MTKKMVIKPAISQKFQEFLKNERILFFSAPCGFGKTAVAQALLEGRRVWKLEGESARGADLETKKDWDILLMEDFQLFQEEEDQQALCALIRRSPDKRFVILSRGSPPGCLMAFQYAGLMTVIGPKDLLFDREDIRQLFNASGLPVSDGEIAGILKESIGYPLGVAITAQNMSSGARFSQEIVGRSYQEVYRYFETAIYQRLDLPYRRFLLELSPFESFNLEMARMVSGNAHAGEMLDWLLRYTTMLLYDGFRQYRFWPQFREFLLWEMDHSYSPEKRRALFNRGGLYFELKEDYSHALDCYAKGGDHAKVSEILIRNAELHPGMGHYSQMEKYYRSLPESEILASPSLMQGMSMLCALSMDYVGSEGWYKKLKAFAQRCDSHDAAGKQARSRLAWLDISLPQRKVDNLTETIPAVFRLMTNKEIHLPPFSVTSALPSIMNGGKDFSPWSKRDDLLYKTIRIPVEAVLGKDGVCLGDCAIAESKFEKGEDIGGRMLSLVSRMSEIQQNGTPDIEFAATGLLARNYLATGQPGNARRALEALRARFVDQGHSRFLPNIDAALCRIALHTGDLDSADTWYREKAPRDPMHLNVMKRYQYLTQAQVELADGTPEAALLTLAPLGPYCENCCRYIDGIHVDVLTALALYRMRREGWQEKLTRAMTTAAEFDFIRTLSVYGAAILPLLAELPWTGNDRWYKRLLAEVRLQNANDPLFLQPRLGKNDVLTTTEKQILRLICADKSNAEIGEILSIRVSTVKSHVSSVLSKLGVNRRSEARTAAKKLWLISEDQ